MHELHVDIISWRLCDTALTSFEGDRKGELKCIRVIWNMFGGRYDYWRFLVELFGIESSNIWTQASTVKWFVGMLGNGKLLH